MNQPVQINSDFIEQNTSFERLVDLLKRAFSDSGAIVPERHHHYFPNPKTEKDTTLLLMPAWNPGEDAGVKIVTVNPDNGSFDLPSIQGSYLYMSATTGVLRAIIEAKSLTAKRTAATSALASTFLSRPDSQSLLMIGTGALSVNLIQAHSAVRPIQDVYVWGRDAKKAESIAQKGFNQQFEIEPVATIEEVISKVDIVSCATLSAEPLVFGKYLKEGQHIDLVGAYKPDMREGDDDMIKMASIFIDSYESGLKGKR